MKHKDPFLGEIELTKLGETPMNDFGESRIDTFYSDEKGNFYIYTWDTTGGDPTPPIFLRKSVVDKIVEFSKQQYMVLPTDYSKLTQPQRREVRLQYIKEQNNLCIYCGGNLDESPPKKITKKPINLDLFPVGFLNYPIHLQHCHKTNMTEGAVHAYCNAVLWQYEGR